MFRVLGALTGSKGSSELSQDQRSKKILSQAHDFEVALQAMDYVLDDHPGKGMALLKNGKSHSQDDDRSVRVLARGVIEFLEATLGFEASVMKKAATTLAEAQQLSQKRRQCFQKLKLKTSSLYPPGTEYAVTYTEACLLHALLMLFSESMVESAKALFKLRKAYHMLQEILNDINAAKASSGASIHSQDANASCASFIAADTSKFKSVDIPYELTPQEQQDRKLMELAEDIYHMRKKRLEGAHIGNSPAAERLRTNLGLQAMSDLSLDSEAKKRPINLSNEEIEQDQATIDEFIHSGVNLCFGILQVVLSLIPPAIGAVLSIVGFHGSREEGLRMIWRSTKDRNIHGGIGLLSLLFYYDGPFQFTDVDFDVPATSEDTDKALSSDLDKPTLLHPGQLLEDSLLRARAVFPNSALWLLQESRMLSSKGRPQDAVDLMDSIDVNGIEMRQVKAIMIFDRAMTLVHLHEFERAAEDLLSLLDISEWSHALYTYFAGCCYLENYRMCQIGMMDTTKMSFYKERATKLIFSSPELAGKKKFMAKNTPLERFMLRKVDQFKRNQFALKLNDPLEAIGVSPVHELTYFYNGYNRMTKSALAVSHRLLTEYKNAMVERCNPDQELIKNFLVSLTLRRLGNLDDGCELLDKHVLSHLFTTETPDKFKYFKKTEDPWLYPTAFYERALFTWKLKGMDGLDECKTWLLRAQNYAEDYELSTRIGMKIKAAIDRLDA
ncbi:LADA_0H12046g1_1 [Lachancea dasiensis]|uniref:LADA_0H12046g1_1 n=1 Tax=Lachancea dasiensis TaxID=1072105 RepID=A0A1G4K3Y6_9SACH|nr:LADA_0H12046g1_1 [Lachancea dasiensis]